MNTITYDSLTSKLKNLPQNILERVSGYVDALLDNNEQDFILSDNQKAILDSQEDVTKNEYTDADELYEILKRSNEL